MNRRKVLILCDYWNPVASANCICVSAILEDLTQRFDVVVLSADCPSLKCWPTGVSFVTVGDIGIRCALSKASENHVAEAAVKVAYKPVAALNVARFPVRSSAWARRFYRAAEDIVSNEGIEFVVCVSYPAESIIAGEKIAEKHPNIPVVLWYLDATAVGMYRSGAAFKFISSASSRSFERRALKKVAGALYLSPAKGFVEELHSSATSQLRFADPPFITSRPIRFEWSASNRPVRILYTGTLAAPDRDPTVFIKSLIPLRKSKKLELSFAGDSNGMLEKFRDDVHDLGILEPSVCDHEVASTDVLLSIGNQDPYLVPSKLFKYISSGKPIIHIKRGCADCCLPYLDRYPLSLVVDDFDPESLKNSVEDFLNHLQSIESFEFNPAELFPEATPLHTVEALVSLASLGNHLNGR